MNSSRSLVMIVLSLVAGVAAVLFAAQWMAAQAAKSNKVVVAAMDIDLGSKLNGQMLALAEWPLGSTPKGAYANLKDLDTRVVKTTVMKGEPILETKLAPVGTAGGLSAIVAEGKRAMTVRVNDVIGVAGFALPGNYVDILVSTEEDPNRQTDNKISKIVLEHILVLAIAQEASRDDTKPKVVSAVTLEVTPEQAELLDLARSVGQLSLVLRNQIDPKAVETVGATRESLLNLKKSIPVAVENPKPVRKRAAVKKPQPIVAAISIPAPEPERQNVEIIKGLDRFTQQFEAATAE